MWEAQIGLDELKNKNPKDTKLSGKGGWIWEEFRVCKFDQNMLYEILKELLEIHKRVSYMLNNDINPHLIFTH